MKIRIVAFLFLVGVFNFIFFRYFYGFSSIGHDFSFFLPQLLDGYYWFLNNGIFVAPWFTPAFCAGQPYFPDPQGIYYSLPQFLTFVVNPLDAVYWSFVAMASLGYCGMFLLCERIFGCDVRWSFVAAALWMFNGFVTHHYLVGHVVFLSVYLVPWVAALLIWSMLEHRLPYKFIYSSGAGFLCAVCFHSGLASLMPPFGLSVLLLVCLAMVRCKIGWVQLLICSGLTFSFATGLSASKLVAEFNYLAQFPRSGYRLPGFQTWSDLIFSVFNMLFHADEKIRVDVLSKMVNLNFGLGAHEFSFEISPLPLVVVCVWLATILCRRATLKDLDSYKFHRLAPLGVMVVICAFLLSTVFYSPEWNGFLKKLPVISATTAPWRWIFALIPLLCLVAAQCLESLSKHLSGRMRNILCVALLCFVCIYFFTLPRDSYEDQGYKSAAVVAAHKFVDANGNAPEIRFLGAHIGPNGLPERVMNGNDLLVDGVSQAFCYNPIFGYGLENFDPVGLGPGSPLKVKGGWLNFKNPACYVFPRENNCIAGDRFVASPDNQERLGKLLSYRPYDFKRSVLQRWSDLLNAVFLTIFFIAALLYGLFVGMGLMNRRKYGRDS